MGETALAAILGLITSQVQVDSVESVSVHGSVPNAVNPPKPSSMLTAGYVNPTYIFAPVAVTRKKMCSVSPVTRAALIFCHFYLVV